MTNKETNQTKQTKTNKPNLTNKQVRSNQEEMLKPHVEKVQATIKAKEERARYVQLLVKIKILIEWLIDFD